MKKEYTVQDVLNNNDEEIVDLLNKYSRIVDEKDKKIEELKELIAEVRTKAPVNSDIFWLLDRVRL
jgi:hemerythrin